MEGYIVYLLLFYCRYSILVRVEIKEKFKDYKIGLSLIEEILVIS